jgi:hypothetical protein
MVAVAFSKVHEKKGVQSSRVAWANADPTVNGRPPAGATTAMVLVCGVPVQVKEADPPPETTV